jgi:hypothetical protein
MSSVSKGSIPNKAAESLDRLRERVVSVVAPFFDDGASNDQALAREAARQMLICYDAGNGKELQLSAQIVVFGMAALDCLRCSMTERDMPVQVLLRMRSNAVALNGLAEKSQKALEARQRHRERGQAATPEAIQLDEAEFQAAIGKAQQMVAFARAKLEAHRVAKALASASAPVGVATHPQRKVSVAPAIPALTAERMTPEALARRKDAELIWANDRSHLTDLQGQTKH